VADGPVALVRLLYVLREYAGDIPGHVCSRVPFLANTFTPHIDHVFLIHINRPRIEDEDPVLPYLPVHGHIDPDQGIGVLRVSVVSSLMSTIFPVKR